MAVFDVRVLGGLWPGALVWVLGIICVLGVIVMLGDQGLAIARARKVSARSAASQADDGEVRVWSTGGSFRGGLGGASNFPNMVLTIGPDQVSLRQMTRIGPATTVVTRTSEHHFRVQGGNRVVDDISGLSARLGGAEAARAHEALLAFGWLAPPAS